MWCCLIIMGTLTHSPNANQPSWWKGCEMARLLVTRFLFRGERGLWGIWAAHLTFQICHNVFIQSFINYEYVCVHNVGVKRLKMREWSLCVDWHFFKGMGQWNVFVCVWNPQCQCDFWLVWALSHTHAHACGIWRARSWVSERCVALRSSLFGSWFRVGFWLLSPR